MIEHPVPQNVTGYQFHLIGDMTLKQFLELGVGVVLAWFLLTLNMPFLIRLPLSIGAALFGFALAFLPVEDRPLDMWVIAFFKAIYRPTLMSWKKSSREDVLTFKPKIEEKGKPLSAAAKAPAAELQSLLQMYELQEGDNMSLDPLEKEWNARKEMLPALFGRVEVPKKLSNETTFPKAMTTGLARPATRVFIHPLSPPENPGAMLRGEITLSPRQPRIPVVEPPLIERTEPVQPTATGLTKEKTMTISGTLPSVRETGVSRSSVAATTNALLLPHMPTAPNVLTGMVFSNDAHLVDGAIVEIRDKDGLPIRALKTNKIGQFSIATPLPDGTYELEVEKDGLTFDILKVEAKGDIIPPIEIRASNKQ